MNQDVSRMTLQGIEDEQSGLSEIRYDLFDTSTPHERLIRKVTQALPKADAVRTSTFSILFEKSDDV